MNVNLHSVPYPQHVGTVLFVTEKAHSYRGARGRRSIGYFLESIRLGLRSY